MKQKRIGRQKLKAVYGFSQEVTKTWEPLANLGVFIFLPDFCCFFILPTPEESGKSISFSIEQDTGSSFLHKI